MKVADPLAGVTPAPPLPPTAPSKGRGSVERFDATLTAAAEASRAASKQARPSARDGDKAQAVDPAADRDAATRKAAATRADGDTEAQQDDDDLSIAAPTDEQVIVDPATPSNETDAPVAEAVVAADGATAAAQHLAGASSSPATSSSNPSAVAAGAVLQETLADAPSQSSAARAATAPPTGASPAAANQPTTASVPGDVPAPLSTPNSAPPITQSPAPTIRSESSPTGDAAASAPAHSQQTDNENLDTGAHAEAQSDDAQQARQKQQATEQSSQSDPSNVPGPHDTAKASASSAAAHDGGDPATGRVNVPTHAPLDVDVASAGSARPAAAASHLPHAPAAAATADGALTTGLAQVDADRVTDRALRGLQGAVNQRGGTVTLRLSPPELGALKIRVQMDGLTVRAQFEAANLAVRQLLHQQMGQLRQALESQGLTVDQLQVQQTQPPQDASNAGGGRDADQPDDGRSRGSFDEPAHGGNQSSRDERGAEMGDLSRFQRELLDLIA